MFERFRAPPPLGWLTATPIVFEATSERERERNIRKGDNIGLL